MHRNGDRLFITIFSGPSPREAQPILASEDQEVIRATLRALGRRLGVDELPEPLHLELVRADEEEEGDGAP